jgi:ubiquinone/menaquinone biosynthesis C-methylase UbiE
MPADASGYDAIATLYDVDMARNMRFDDAAFYAQRCREAGTRILELGCGNGRILLALAEQGFDAVGVDASGPMLDELKMNAAARGVAARAMRMDARHLALDAHFDAVLCPYSLVTYMSAAGDATRLLDEARRVLRPGGSLVIDAFVPKPQAAMGDFVHDYRRPLGAFVLERSKRITPLHDGINRIERRYRILTADGLLERQIDVCEVIRPFTPEALVALLAANGFDVDAAWWDYSSQLRTPDAQFFTVTARP